MAIAIRRRASVRIGQRCRIGEGEILEMGMGGRRVWFRCTHCCAIGLGRGGAWVKHGG
jgi:hypothetical protein